VILAVRMSLQIVLDALQMEETAAIDSAPVPCVSYKRSKQASDFVGSADYGVCSSKAMKYFGYKFHSVVSLAGLIMGFRLTPASRYDNQPVVELLDSFSQHLKRRHGRWSLQ
jgi:Transposase DDE domain